jgi:vesicle-fusing ATPase
LVTKHCVLQSQTSLVILDNIERIVEYVPIGPRFSNTLLQLILDLLEKPPPKGRKLMVIGTSSDAGVMKDLGVVDAFNMVFNVPLLKEDEVRQVFVELAAFQPHEVRSFLVGMPYHILELVYIGASQ